MVGCLPGRGGVYGASTVVSEIEGMARRSEEEIFAATVITSLVGIAVSILMAIVWIVTAIVWIVGVCITLGLTLVQLPFRPSASAAKPIRNPSQNLKHKVLLRSGGRCVQCGTMDDLQYDHIHPWSKGGRTTFENLQMLCRSCNAKKRDKVPRSPPLSPVHDRIQVADDPQRSRFKLALGKTCTFLGFVLGVIILLFFLFVFGVLIVAVALSLRPM